MNRRGFLAGILAACAAPAIVRADSLMRIVPLETTVIHEWTVDSIIADPVVMVADYTQELEEIIFDLAPEETTFTSVLRTNLQTYRWDLEALR